MAGRCSVSNRSATQVAWALSLLAAVGSTAGARPPRKQGGNFLRQGNSAFDHGRFADAVAAYTRGLERDAANPKLFYDRALANEMVDRRAAIQDWRKFLDLAGSDPGWTSQVARVRARVRRLEAMPALPAGLQAGRYAAKFGDYYDQLAGGSTSPPWTEFPLKVFVGSPPQGWQQPLQEALNAWGEVVPLRTVTTSDDADISLNWTSMPKKSELSELAGSEQHLTHVETEGGKEVVRRRKSFIVLDASRHWSEDQMRVNLLHELGHALGINGHSDSLKDLMTSEELAATVVRQETGGTEPDPRATLARPPGVESESHGGTKLTLRDVNTLIRLYNSPEPLPLLR